MTKRRYPSFARHVLNIIDTLELDRLIIAELTKSLQKAELLTPKYAKLLKEILDSSSKKLKTLARNRLDKDKDKDTNKTGAEDVPDETKNTDVKNAVDLSNALDEITQKLDLFISKDLNKDPLEHIREMHQLSHEILETANQYLLQTRGATRHSTNGEDKGEEEDRERLNKEIMMLIFMVSVALLAYFGVAPPILLGVVQVVEIGMMIHEIVDLWNRNTKTANTHIDHLYTEVLDSNELQEMILKLKKLDKYLAHILETTSHDNIQELSLRLRDLSEIKTLSSILSDPDQLDQIYRMILQQELMGHSGYSPGLEKTLEEEQNEYSKNFASSIKTSEDEEVDISVALANATIAHNEHKSFINNLTKIFVTNPGFSQTDKLTAKRVIDDYDRAVNEKLQALVGELYTSCGKTLTSDLINSEGIESQCKLTSKSLGLRSLRV
ncbi:MAG: hypothetical protein EB127_04335 [Alphaproteobacteria bacterium]|nr:hypothetical protein [Alphaproteobacteria bacterium]